MKHRKTRFFFLLLSMLLLTGCSSAGGVFSNYRDIEKLQLVQTMGLDFEDDGVTLSISSGNSPENPSPTIISCHAPSISSAMDKIQNYTAKEEFFYAHMQYIIIGASTAEHALENIIDYIERLPQMRVDIRLFILKNGKASDLITTATNSEYELTALLSSMERDLELAGTGDVLTCAEIAQSLSTSNSALVTAISMTTTKDKVFSTSDTEIALSDGYAFFKDGSLLGFLNPKVSVGVNVLLGKPGQSYFNLKDQNGNPVTIQLSTASTKLSPVWASDGTLEALSVSVDATASVVELTTDTNLYNEAYLLDLDQKLSLSLLDRIRSALRASQKYNADFLELGKKIRIKDPVRFEKMPTEWKDMLPELRLTLSVNGTLNRTYSITDPANMNGGGVGNAET